MTKVSDGYWWARYEGPAEIVEVKGAFAFRICDREQHPQHRFKFLQPVVDINTLMLRDLAMQQLEKAASESEWMPPEYSANDWQSDCCSYLRFGGNINYESPTSHGDEWAPHTALAPKNCPVGGTESLTCLHAFDERGLGLVCVHCGSSLAEVKKQIDDKEATASLYGDLDFPAPNHYDPSKRGFSPK